MTTSTVDLSRFMSLTRHQTNEMVCASRTHDREFGRECDASDFITCEAIAGMITSQEDRCLYCTHPFDHTTPNRKHPDSPTIERLDEARAHVVDNCVLVCTHCNNARGGKTAEEMKTHGFGMKFGWTKYCSPCKTFFENPEEVFNKDRRTHDGLRTICRSCQSDCGALYRANKKAARG